MSLLQDERHEHRRTNLRSPELDALITQMEQERQTFDARMLALQDCVIEVRIAAQGVMQCARAVAVQADKEATR